MLAYIANSRYPYIIESTDFMMNNITISTGDYTLISRHKPTSYFKKKLGELKLKIVIALKLIVAVKLLSVFAPKWVNDIS